VTALLLLRLLLPSDTTLVSVELIETRESIVVEAVVTDSTVRLPNNALRDLLGVSFVGPWVSLEQLRTQYPTLVVQWRPAELRVLIFDELGNLPATRAFHEHHRATAFGTAPIPTISGPWGSFAVDDQRRALLDAGYLWRGRVQVAGRVDDRGITQWNVSAVPNAHVFLSSSGGTKQPTQVSTRLMLGPVWILSTYTPYRPLEVAGLVRGGPVTAFASTQYGVLTITPSSQWTVQLAQRWADHRTVGRLSFGPTFASPFGFPVSSLSH